ncbi:hypothetical protein CKO12_01810 [Chromatium okenii]|nr:hypothetical protein [Chromatium okenii]
MNDVRQSEQIRRIAAAVQMLSFASLIVLALLFSAAAQRSRSPQRPLLIRPLSVGAAAPQLPQIRCNALSR